MEMGFMLKSIYMCNRSATLRGIAIVVAVLNFVFWSFRFRSAGDAFMLGVILGAFTFGVIYVALLEVISREVKEEKDRAK
jgi:hypothetical protein